MKDYVGSLYHLHLLTLVAGRWNIRVTQPTQHSHHLPARSPSLMLADPWALVASLSALQCSDHIQTQGAPPGSYRKPTSFHTKT